MKSTEGGWGWGKPGSGVAAIAVQIDMLVTPM